MTAAGIVLPKTKKQMQQKKTWTHFAKTARETAAGSVLL